MRSSLITIFDNSHFQSKNHAEENFLLQFHIAAPPALLQMLELQPQGSDSLALHVASQYTHQVQTIT